MGNMKEKIMQRITPEKSSNEFSPLEGRITYIQKLKNDHIEINLLIDDILIKSLILIKGEIYPIPNINDKLSFKKYEFGITTLNELGIIIHDLSITKNDKQIFNDKTNEIIDFSGKNIFKTFKNEYEMNIDIDKIRKDIFYVIDKYSSKYKLISFKSKTIFFVSKDIIKFESKTQNFVSIDYFVIENGILKIFPFTIIQILNDKQIFKLLENNDFQDIIIAKITHIDYTKEKCLLVSKKMNLIEVNFKTLKEKVTSLELLQFFLFISCGLTNNDKEFKNLLINENTIIYKSTENIFLDKSLYLNTVTPLKIICHDFLINNYYNKIVINGRRIIIKKKIQYEIINNLFQYKFQDDYIVLTELYKSDKDEDKEDSRQFFVNIQNGVLNKINIFINNSNKEYFSFEFLYYSFKPEDLYKYIFKFNFNQTEYIINEHDNYNSILRKRYNLINIPNIFHLIKNYIKFDMSGEFLNSFLICITLDNNEEKLYGIFKRKIKNIDYFSNNYFEDFYNIVGNYYDILNKEKDIKKIKEYNDNINKNELIIKMKSDCYLKSYFYDDDITLSQYKSRLGLILNNFFNKTMDEFIEIYQKFEVFINKLRDIICQLNNYTYNEKLRIISFYLDYFRISNLITDPILINLDELEENSPYKIAINFNLEIIKNLEEESFLFLPYLQLDSNVSDNLIINDGEKKCYTLSIEPLFILKQHLLSVYDKFFYIINNCQLKYFALHFININITAINEFYFFPDYKGTKVREINSQPDSNNLAFPISMEMIHLKSSHQKSVLKYYLEEEPKLYFDGKKLNTLIVNGKKKGEAGRLIESFINNESKIYEMKLSRHLGSLLDYKLFVSKTTDRLNDIMLELDKKKKVVKFSQLIKEDKIVDMFNEDLLQNHIIREKIPIGSYLFYNITDKTRIEENNKLIDNMVGYDIY